MVSRYVVNPYGNIKVYSHIGEINITKGSFKGGIIQMVSSNASLSPNTIMDAADPTQALFFQLYKHKDDDTAEKRVREIERLGYKAIFLTVDAIVAGNREREIRIPFAEEDEENGPVYYQADDIQKPKKEVNSLGIAGAFVANDDRDMTWEKVTLP